MLLLYAGFATWLSCRLRGHELPTAPAYGMLLDDGQAKEMYFCQRCGSPVWRVHSPEEASSPTAPSPDSPPHPPPDTPEGAAEVWEDVRV